MKKIAYVRVSTPEQRHDRQIAGLMGLCDELHIETLSACNTRRPVYNRLVRRLKSGDVLVVWDLDRAFRSVVDALNEAEKLKARGVHFQIANLGIDTRTPAGIFVYTMLSALAVFERQMLSQRTKEGLAAARARGKRIGRPPLLSLDQLRDAKARIVDERRSIAQVADAMGVQRWTLSRSLRRLAVSEAVPAV